MHGKPLTIGVSTVVAPQIDDDTTTALEQAVDTLRLLRDGERYNSADHLTALASLAAAAQAAIPDAIADTVEQGFTWPQIAHCSGLAITTARRRHAQAQPREPNLSGLNPSNPATNQARPEHKFQGRRQPST